MIPRPRVASLLPHSLDLQPPLIRKVRTPGTAPRSHRMVQIREAWTKAVKFFPDPKIALAAMMPLQCFPPQYHQSLLIARPLCQGSSHLKATQPQCTQEKEYPKNSQQNKTPHSQFHSRPPQIPTDLCKPHTGGGTEDPRAQCRAQGTCLCKVEDWSSTA